MDKDTLVPIFLVVCIAIFFIRSFNRTRKNKKDFDNLCGGKDHLKYENFSGYCGIALNANTKTLFLKVDKNQKAYPFSDVRNWQMDDQFLIIQTRDVDYPEWKMTGIPRKKWFEILNQEINES